MGILHLLDEECAIQKGTDENLVQKLRDRHANHPYFLAPKRERDCFTVRHYAGDVMYLSAGFREKNKDALHPDLSALMQESQLPFIRGLFPADAAATCGPPGANVRTLPPLSMSGSRSSRVPVAVYVAYV